MAKTFTIRLDRPRRLRLTPFAFDQLKSFYGVESYAEAWVALDAEGGWKNLAGVLWLFTVSDDPDLTVEGMRLDSPCSTRPEETGATGNFHDEYEGLGILKTSLARVKPRGRRCPGTPGRA